MSEKKLHVEFIQKIFLNNSASDFPRIMGWLKKDKNGLLSHGRATINDINHMQRYCTVYNKDLFCRPISEYEREQRIYDLIFLDIDVYDNTIYRVLQLLDEINVKRRLVIDTKGKGYHVYFQMPYIQLDDYGAAVRLWLKKTGLLSLVDTHVNEHSRIMRVPYCLRTDYNTMPTIVTEPELEPTDVITPLETNYNMAIEVENVKIESLRYNYAGHTITTKNRPDMPPCMERLFNHAIKGGYLKYQEYRELVLYMAKLYSPNFIHHILSKCANYDARELDADIRRAVERNQLNMKCSNMVQAGLCPRKCEMYPSINRYIIEKLEK